VNLVGLDWLLEQLAQHPVLSVQLTAVECWLLSLAEQMVASGSLIQKSLPLLQQPLADLQHLYLQVPKSRRQFERRFKLETGFSPAQLQLLYKVKLARLLISRNPSCDLASIAQDAGFYDQSHFHQHFVRITGQTPGQYKKRKMSQISNFHR
jgi:transcriptional regulator GlxA family with amidase domain